MMSNFFVKLFYTVSTVIVWKYLDFVLFKNGEKRWTLTLAHILLLTFLQMLGPLVTNGILTPFISIIVSILIQRVERKVPWKTLFVEQSFTYALASISGVLCVPLASLVCIFLLHTEAYSYVMMVRVIFLAVLCYGTYLVVRKHDFKRLGNRYALGIFGVTITFFLAFFSKLRTNYEPSQRDLYLYLLLTMLACAALFIAWAKREQAVLRDMDAAERIKNERDDLASQNHKLSKTLPALENQYEEMQTQVTIMKTYGVEELSKEILERKSTVSKVRTELELQREQEYYEQIQFEKTGIDLLDSELKCRAKEAVNKSVYFDCHVISTADFLIKSKTISELQLQQVLSNILDNAIHSADKSKSERIVICSMGVAGTAYQLRVSDSGPYFEPRVLAALGQPNNTTDGNGFGLMHVIQILSGCSASLIIEEYSPARPSGITKSITARFDGMGVLSVHPAAEGGRPDEPLCNNGRSVRGRG